MDTKKTYIQICFALFLFAFVLYGNTIGNEYALDDEMVTNNEQVRKGIKAIPEIFTTNYRITDEYNYGYRPIVKSSFAIEHQLFGENPHVGHFINVLIYGFTGIFLFLLLVQMLQGYHALFPMVITILFLAHPIHTEAVASLKNREELISFLCSLAALYLLLKSVVKFRAINIVGGLTFFIIGFLTKQNAATFLVIIPLSIYFFTDIALPVVRRPKMAIKEIMPQVDASLTRYIIPIIGLGFFVVGMVWNVYAILATLALVFLDKWNAGRTSGRQNNIDLNYKQALIIGGCYCAVILNDNFLEFEVIKPLYVLLALPYFLYLRDIVLAISSGPNSGSQSPIRTNFILLIGLAFFAAAELLSDRSFLLFAFIILIIDISVAYRQSGINWRRIFFNGYFIAGVIALLASEYALKTLGFVSVGESEGVMLNTYLLLLLYGVYFVDKNGLFSKYFGRAQRFINRIISVQVSKAIGISFTIVGVLTIATYLLMVLPTELLPPEHREIFYFENPLINESDFSTIYGTGLYTMLLYIKLLVLPHPLLFYYGFDHVPILELTNGWVIFSMILHALLLVYALFNLKRKHILSYAILYYLATIFVFSNILFKIPGIVAERLLYMPSLGFCIALTYLLFKLLKIDPKSKLSGSGAKLKLGFALALIVVPYSVKTITRNSDWENHTTLYLHDIPYLEKSLHANSLVASQMLRSINPHPKSQAQAAQNQKNLLLVIKHFNQVLELDPNNVKTLNNLGMVYYDFYQDFKKAVEHFESAVNIDGATAKSMFNIGYCYDQLGNVNLAKSAYLKSLAIDENQIESVSNLSNLYFKLGVRDSALYLNDRLVQIDSTLDLPYINVGNYYLQMNKEAEAVSMFEKAIELNPDNVKLGLALIDYFKEQGDQRKIEYYTKLFANKQ